MALRAAPVDPALVLSCRPGQLVQALVNLVANACDANEGREHAWVEVGARGQGDYAVFQVSDSGPGVPPTERAVIFRPFYTSKAPGKGTGLGLAVVSRIAEEHGGSALFDAAAPHTRFLVRVPRQLTTAL